MATITVKDHSGADQGELELADSVFGAPVNAHCVRQALNAYLANQRQGTAKTKTRGEVSGSGAKPWRQKGTGRARAGSNRSPLWRGGATLFGPVPRSYRAKVNTKVRRIALRSVLSARLQEEAVTVVDHLNLPQAKTGQVVGLLDRLGLRGRVLIVAPQSDADLIRSARNVGGVQVVVPENLNVFNLLGHERLLFSRASVQRVVELFGAS
jgi:large subunit ribosomal protein L4